MVLLILSGAHMLVKMCLCDDVGVLCVGVHMLVYFLWCTCVGVHTLMKCVGVFQLVCCHGCIYAGASMSV